MTLAPRRCPIHDVKQRSLLRSRGALLRPGSLSSLSLLSAGWVERQPHPSPAQRGPGSTGFAQSAQPILRNSHLPFLCSRDIRARVLPSFSAFLIPDRGDGGAPGGGILYPVAPVTTRRHVCEAWAVPRNRNGASRRSTVTILGPVPALRLRSCLRCLSRATLAPGACVRSAKGPEPPARGLRAAPGRHLPLRLQETLLESAPR
jgi:hypothetical protein